MAYLTDRTNVTHSKLWATNNLFIREGNGKKVLHKGAVVKGKV